MIVTLGSGFPVAFALPGSAILAIGAAAGAGYLFAGSANAYFAQGGAIDWLTAGVTNFRGIYWEADRDTLIAIPLFVFMGIMLQRSRIAEELLVTMAKLFGPLPGGLGISVVFVGALLAATTGIVGATVVAMGLISLPAMMRNNYSQPLATGTILASGTLGQIIPPSIVLIILADQLSSAVDQASSARQAYYRESTGNATMPSEFDVVSTSAGDMFMGAFIPGLILVGLYMVYIFAYALIRPKNAPSVRVEGAMDRRFWINVVLALVPPLGLIVIVLGSIITGVATVTQAGAIGAAGATVMAGYKLYDGGRLKYVPAIVAILSLVAITILYNNYNLNVRALGSTGDHVGVVLAAIAVVVLLGSIAWSFWRTLRIDNTLQGVMIETAKTTTLVFIILLGAAMLTSAFRAFGGEELVREFLTGLPGGFWTQFIIVMTVIFFLGFFLDFIEIAIVVVPIVAPILLADPEANITAVWLGVMIGLMIQTSFLTPPFGFALFYLRGVASAAVRTVSMYKGVVPFITLQIVSLVIVGFSPPLANYLPNRIALLSTTAPPPRNPRLQECVEQLVTTELRQNGSAIRKAIADLNAAERGFLPAPVRRELDSRVERIGQTLDLLGALNSAKAVVAGATGEYRPLHREVSRIKRDAAALDREVRLLTDRLLLFRGDDPDMVAAREGIQERIRERRAERSTLLASIPREWDPKHDAFLALVKNEQDARLAYRRAADQGYATLRELRNMIDSSEALAEIDVQIRSLPAMIATAPAAEVAERTQAMERALNAVPGSAELRAELTKIRRALTRRTPDTERARRDADTLVAASATETRWRQQAEAGLLPLIAALEEAARTNVGLREQSRFPREQALWIASCNSGHRDISLRF